MVIYYEKAKIGESYVAKMLPELAEALGLPHLTNAQVRTSSVMKLKEAKFEDRAVMSVTGHRKIETLQNYDRGPNNSKKLEMAKAIFTSKKKIAVPSCTITSGQMVETSQVAMAEGFPCI